MPGSFISNYFGFNRQQRNGLLVLVCVSLLLFAVRIIYPYFIKPDRIILKNLPLIERKTTYSGYEERSYSNEKRNPEISHAFFVFDPNKVTHEQLLQLGFKEKTAGIFIKFRNKGFVFKEKKDLKKVFGISDKFYAAIAPYILLDEKKNNVWQEAKTSGTPTVSQVQASLKIDLNSADSLTLLSLNGIGPAFAKRILKYRSMLGGFVAAEQLKEVYGFTEELYDKVKNSVYVKETEVKKIDLNKDDFKTINKHPYIGYELTKIIFDWRRKTIITSTNLKDILNDASLYARLMPYLAFE